MKVSEYIAKFLKENGIKDCFMVTGGGAMHLDDAIGHAEGIRCVFNHHEQACAVAAEAYARYTGRLAAVCVTSGPGGTNAITGVMGGWLDSIPMFVLSGQVKRETMISACPDLNLRQLGDQEFDIIGSVRNMTKYAVCVTEPNTIAYHLEKALYLATSGRKGPVWLDIPLDVQAAQIREQELQHFTGQVENAWSVPELSADRAKQILSMIRKAKAPLLLAGTGVRLAGAEEELLRLVKKLGIPVVTAWNANDVLAFDDPHFVGMPGTVGIRSGNFAVQNCDLLLSIGCRLNIRMIGYTHHDFAKRAFKIIVDIDARELIKPTVHADMPVHADAKQFMQALLAEEYGEPVHQRWREWCKNLLLKYPACKDSCRSAEQFNPYDFVDRLFGVLNADDKIICGNGSACVITFQACKVKQGQRMFTNSGCAAMGYGLPAALGVAVANNRNRTVCIDGDGSVMMNIQELATIAHNRLNVKLFIINNHGYHSIRQTQTNLFKPPFIGIDDQSGLSFPDFGMLARSFGLDYVRIASAKEFEQKIGSVLSGSSPVVAEVVVDPSQNFEPKSSSKILPDGRIVSPSLDDMAPFLDRKEFEQIKFQ